MGTTIRSKTMPRPPGNDRCQLGWIVVAAVWFGGIAVWRVPFLHWHHSPVAGAVIQSLVYLAAFLGVGSLMVYLISARAPTEPASKNISYIPRLDHLRFYAASLVVFYHYYHTVIPAGSPVRNPLFSLFSEGSSGVDLFFVLSGVIFGLISYGKTVRYGDFLWSRVVRIYPLYLFAILIAWGSNYGVFSAGDIALMLFPIFEVTAFPGGLPGFGQLWTIGIEFQFYLIFPFLATFVLRNGSRYLWGLLVLAIGVRCLHFSQAGSAKDIAYWSLLGRIDEFIAGLLAARLHAARPKFFSHPVHVFAAALVAFGCIYWLSLWGGYFNGADSALWIVWPTIEGAFWSYLVLAYLSCRWSPFPALGTWLAGLGQLSFSIYVMHIFAVVWTQKYLAPVHLTASREWDAALGAVLVCLPLAVLSAVPTYHLIEKQFFIYRRRYIEVERDLGRALDA